MFKLLILCGSIREASSSAALARAISQRLSQKALVSTFDIGALPHYDAGLERPESIAGLIAAIGEAEGVLFITPEYNYSIPGVLKNAIDWASRPAYNSVFRGKPAFVISTSGGAMGGVRAQSHLKYILDGMLARPFPWQEVVVPFAPKKIEEGRFTDGDVLDFATTALNAFIDWASQDIDRNR